MFAERLRAVRARVQGEGRQLARVVHVPASAMAGQVARRTSRDSRRSSANSPRASTGSRARPGRRATRRKFRLAGMPVRLRRADVAPGPPPRGAVVRSGSGSDRRRHPARGTAQAGSGGRVRVVPRWSTSGARRSWRSSRGCSSRTTGSRGRVGRAERVGAAVPDSAPACPFPSDLARAPPRPRPSPTIARGGARRPTPLEAAARPPRCRPTTTASPRISAMKPLRSRRSPSIRTRRLHPLDEPARALGLFGWEEDKLTGYEERRVKDLWYEVPDGDLHVGRPKPREGTGPWTAPPISVDAFVRTREWIRAGRYVITARIQVHDVVRGRGRDPRLHAAGPERPACTSTGAISSTRSGPRRTRRSSSRSAEPPRPEGTRRRLWGALPGTGVRFKPPTNNFSLRILVDGAQVHAYVNDELHRHVPHDRRPAVEGYVGFAAGHGAYLVAAPTVQRRDRSAAAGADPAWPKGARPRVAGNQTRREILNLALPRHSRRRHRRSRALDPRPRDRRRGPALGIDYIGLAVEHRDGARRGA